MRERSGTVIGALVVLLLIMPLGFLIHVSPRFPGSLAGGLIGIAGAVLMLVALAYVPLKRIPALHDRIARRISARTLLALHVYAGVLGPLLGLIHAAHKFNSPLSISLTGTMLLVVLSGYVGRYFMGQIARAVRGRRSELSALRSAAAQRSPDQESDPGLSASRRRRWLALLLVPEAPEGPPARPEAEDLASAIADTEYAIRSEELVSRLLSKWLTLHILLAIVLVLLLALHIWAGLYYGLRWL